MPLRLYNTLNRQKEDFTPLDPEGKKVSFYNCGPTVYGPFHIGNGRNFVVVDTMRRWLEASGYQVRFVQNITDVDDKIINRAKVEGVGSAEVAEKYTKLFFEHLALLGVRRADEHPKATEHIGGMIELVQTLIDRGHAYASEDGSVWYSVSSFQGYGKLSRKNLDDMRQGERVAAEQQRLKRAPEDFSLWKAAKPGEPAWDSPWGKGRPGWHLECSCMSMKCHNAPTIDIHSGGTDLTFPHHENEIAQSEGATGKPFVRYWLHNGFVNIDGEKMSKSLGNFKTIDGLLEHYDSLTLRHFLLSAHYRSELDFTVENLDSAKKACGRYALACAEARRVLGDAAVEADAWKSHTDLMAAWEKFACAMDDDFNTPGAFGALFEALPLLNAERTAVEKGSGDRARLAAALSLIEAMRAVLGVTADLEATDTGGGDDLSAALLDLLVETRTEARRAKQFAIADTIRQRLGGLGIVLEDKPGGETIWRKG
ncbi:MAG: cysteine--tRNA ligase [Sumerlaeia bacterium]